MAKKAKKDKTIAKLRSQLTSTQQELARIRQEIAELKGEREETKAESEEVKNVPGSVKKQSSKTVEKVWEYPPELVKKDLLKTLSLSGLAILSLLVLYWFNLSN